ncbi:MAG: hypothetical protein ACI9R3_001785 [Verrucomicrobiales bacterium]|jgi:hypothetical protein
MKKWYFLVLIGTLIGGWFAYPHVYPKITAYLDTGEVPWKDMASIKDLMPGTEVEVDETSTPSASKGTYRSRPQAKPPTFEPINELVGNWKKIPDSAFPRNIKLKKAVNYNIADGTGSLPSGSNVVALSTDGNGTLSVAPNDKSDLRGQVAIDDTDFKAVLTDVYKIFQKRKLAQFEAAQAEMAAEEPDEFEIPAVADLSPGMATGSNTPMPAKPANIDAKTRAIIGEPPLQFVSGTVPVMVQSMKSGQVTEIKPDMIKYWARLHFSTVQGEPYWVGRVDYTTNSIFGIFPTQAKALIRKGKVVKWIYSGSEEPVP